MVSGQIAPTSTVQLEAHPQALQDALAALTPQSLNGRGLRIPTPDGETYRLTTTHPNLGELLIEASRVEISHSGGWLWDHRRDVTFTADMTSDFGVFHAALADCGQIFEKLRTTHQAYAEEQRSLSREYQSGLEAKVRRAVAGLPSDLIGYNAPTEDGRARFVLEDGEFKTVIGTRVSRHFGFTSVKPYAKTYLAHVTLAHTDEGSLARALQEIVPHAIPQLRHTRDQTPWLE